MKNSPVLILVSLLFQCGFDLPKMKKNQIEKYLTVCKKKVRKPGWAYEQISASVESEMLIL